MARLIVGLIVGVLVGGLTVGLVEALGHALFPLPADIDVSKPEVLRTLMDLIPLNNKIAVIVAWTLGIFAGGCTAAYLAKRGPVPAWWVGGILFSMAVSTMISIPHPTWMWIAAIAATIVGSYVAGRIAGRQSPTPLNDKAAPAAD